MEITASYFKECTGDEPRNDDLERCNCQKAGEHGHRYCGWNHDLKLPVFYGGADQSKISSGYYKINLEK